MANHSPATYNIVYNDSNIIIVNHIEEYKGPQREHPKGYLIFLVLQRGEMQLNIDYRQHVLHKDEVLLCFPQQDVTEVCASEDFQGSVILIKAELVKSLIHSSMQALKDFFYLHKHPVLHLSQKARHVMAHYLTLLRYRYENPTESYNTDIVNAILQAMLYEMMNLIGRTAKPEDSHIIRQGERLFKRFMELLVNDKVRSRSVSDYSERLCVTSKYLSAVCKQLTGRTASSWINEFVMKDVVRQLHYTDLSIKEISLRLGFPNVSFFGKYVKNQLGISPSEYRKMNVKE